MQRHRNPANGYRSNPIGIGGGGGGGVAAGGPGYRSYNRGGLGRSQPPPPRRIDVFFEAGKLATEYLVAKGLLPPNPLEAKWQNSNLKNQIGGDDGVSDAVSGTGGGGRRRLSDDIRGRRTLGSFRNSGFEWNRENNRSGSWSEKVKSSSDKQGDGESFSGSMEEQRSGKDGGSDEQKSVSGDLESKSYDTGNLDTSIQSQQNHSPDDNVAVNTPNSDVSQKGNVESAERSDGIKNTVMSTDDVMMDDNDQESEKPIVKEESPEENNINNNTANNNSSDLLTLIRFNKIPTRTRSSLTLKGSKSDSVLTAGDENKNKIQNPVKLENSLPDDENQGLKSLNHELKIEEISSEEDQKYKFGHGVCTRSQSFPQRSSIEQELGEGQIGYSRSSSAVLGRGEKRPMSINDNIEAAKKPRNWGSDNTQLDDLIHLSNSRGDQSSSSQQCNVYTEEKQLFPNSFKICDLNLMGGSEANENHDANSVIGFSSLGHAKQEPVSVDFDLSMNSSNDITDRHNNIRESDNKEVEIIDLDCDSGQEDKVFNNSERREEAIFTDLESFPDSMQRVSDMPQDGYGLMISELLEADIPTSTAQSTVNSMHNDISLQNDEEILGDDESIYMSLGEIPISFVPVWDQQPSQGYDKRY